MERVQLVIIGGGPAGLAAAAQASSVGMDYVLLDRAAHFADTIENFTKGKLVMNTPKRLPLHPGLKLSFAEGPVERVLATWRGELARLGVLEHVRLGSEVTGVAREGEVFRVALASGETIAAENVVLGLGTQGNITKLDVPGAERVVYQLHDPTEYEDRDIVVIGSGDTAIENALALATRNRVTMVVRGREFKPEKVTVANLASVEAAIRSGRLACRFSAATVRIEPRRIVLSVAGVEETLDCDRVIARIGSVKPRKFLESCGVRFEGADDNADPALDQYYRAAEGLYVVGALAGYPLIKHCLNQGYEVVEHIRGVPVAPADEPVLAGIFACIAQRASVDRVLRRVTSLVPLFAGLSRLTLGDVLLDSKVVRKKIGDPIVRRDEYGDSIFAILDGTAAVEINPDDPSQNRVLRAGDFFGEIGLMSGRPRSATVRATDNCALIEVPRRAALKLLTTAPSVKSKMDEALVVRQLRAYVSEDLAGEDIEDLVAAVTPVAFAFGDTIIAPGAPQTDVYLIQSGSAKVSCQSWGRDVVLRYLPAGQIVGEYVHLADQPPTVTVTSATKTVAMRIDGGAFARVIERNPVLKARLKARMEQQLRENAKTLERVSSFGGLFNDFLAEGVGEATNVLVIDESLCIRCDNCEKACADTHGGVSRLDREAGPTYATLHVPTSCRHCQDPHCMTDCPADAIHRALNGEVYIDDSCIGCGACERNCPYGVIQMAAVSTKKQNLLLWLLFGSGNAPGDGGSEVDVAERPGTKHAVKCDMCQGIGGGPACVSACPTGAAMRVDPNQLLSLTRGVRA
ncbi:MAG TPA: cyclic nucleotide-binding domain-containing protein [Stellaceae bacterium]|nr:cyclic nucleotide-binding domain-containing protein [Stellaceae bacterium]